MPDLGEQIYAGRRALGWSQRELAKAARVHPNTICTAERTGRITTETLSRIVDALGVEITIPAHQSGQPSRREIGRGRE